MKRHWSFVLGHWSRQRGFALLIVLTLLAFLVLLLVGLASVTRVETAVAGNTQRQAQARQNALLALNLAVGHLQRYAGPDRNVTATADALGAPHRHFTGVWNANGPVTWLVSGNETFSSVGANNPLSFGPASALTSTGANPNAAELVGKNSSGTANDVVAPLVPLDADGVPGTATTATLGRYAWWVGDQGVKAAVGVADVTSNITYGPYASADLRARIAQQITTGAGAADVSGKVVFEPRDNNNAALVANSRVAAYGQLAFLRNASAAAIGLPVTQQNFHTWSPANYSVLANSKSGGLRMDLSVNPQLLGSGYTAWADYGAYMEDPNVDVAAPTPAILPAYGSDPVRRRYRIQRFNAADGAAPTATPVLTYFLLTFNVGTNGSTAANAPVMVRARWMVSFWNPFSAAFVPPDALRLEIRNLPRVALDDEVPIEHQVGSIDLTSLYGSNLSINLPWDAASSSAADRQSWLPGRVYTWTSLENLTGSPPTSSGFESKFNSHALSNDARQGLQVVIPGLTVDGSHASHLHGTSATLRITLFNGDTPLGTFLSPAYEDFTASGPTFDTKEYQFSFVFRLAEPIDGAPWLQTSDDPRAGTVNSTLFRALPNGPFPEQYREFAKIDEPDRLLDRSPGSRAYDEDVPVFELPRAPLLSIGALQHLPLAGQRPFSIGNSWATNAELNGIPVGELFDRFFFSGAVPNVAPTTVNGALLLPNPLLKVLPRTTTSAPVTINDLQDAAAPASRLALQGGAFNVNSANTLAWAAVLRGVRFPAPKSFSYLNSAFSSGTAGDGSKASVQSADAQFFRFSQSAQEVYKSDAGYAASTVAPPDAPDVASNANTHLYRQGMRTLTTDQIGTLAGKIVESVKAHQATFGPFRSLEEFLAPINSGPSLLEQAIADANINVDANGDPIEFSSQFLTQADIMTALAPVLFARSDTFLVRAYGEAVNPVTGATEGRAWCEATVQRVPEYFDPKDDATVAPADLTSDLNKLYGRRFKVVSFRWLTRSDI